MQTKIKDDRGRLHYNPEIHFRHGQPWTVSELIYFCHFYESEGTGSLQYTLGRTMKVMQNKANQLRKQGIFTHYQSMPLQELEWIQYD